MKFIPTTLAAAALLAATGAAQAGHGHGHGFGKIDADGDGAISREESLQMRMSMFEKLDADGDGYVTDEERQAARDAFKARQEADRKKRGRDKMAVMDTDGDGRISQTEMQNAPTPWFDKADADGDGRITREEMKAMRQAHHGKHRGDKGLAPDAASGITVVPDGARGCGNQHGCGNGGALWGGSLSGDDAPPAHTCPTICNHPCRAPYKSAPVHAP